ncbi:MAG: TetR/AcrR family transcriptional regulator [Chloroflexota bacterium]
MAFPEWPYFQSYILQLEQDGLVTRTFRRLDPQRQQAVLDAIFDEAVEKGPTALNVKEIARRAGVAVGSLYQYFPDRSRLLEFAVQLCVRYLTGMFAQFRPMLAAMPLHEAFYAYLGGGVEWGSTQKALIRFFGRAAYQGDPALEAGLVRPVAEEMFQTTREILVQAAARGEVRTGIDLEAMARAINTLIVAAGDSQLLPFLNVYLQTSGENMPFVRVLDALLALIEQGIAP